MKPMGQQGGAGNLIICEVLVMHVDEHILDEKIKYCPVKFGQVGRLGGDWYATWTSLCFLNYPNRN